jgi:hypothetical protein
MHKKSLMNLNSGKLSCLILIVLCHHLLASPWDEFTQVKLTEEYSEVLPKAELVLENGGGKLIKMPDGALWVIGIGSTSVKTPLSGTEILRQRKVAEQKARKAIVEELQTIQVASTTKDTSESIVTTINGQETAQSVDEFEETIESKVEGIVRGLKLAGTWYSQDGQIFYLALCNRLK